MDHGKWLAGLFPAALIAATAYLVVVSPPVPPSARPAAVPAAGTATPRPSNCEAQLNKSVDPATVGLGGSVKASLEVDAACGETRNPVDLVIVADESFSMVKESGGGVIPTEVPTRDPNQTPLPPTLDPGQGAEPSFCNQGGGGLGSPTPTPRRRRTPTPGPGDPYEDALEVPGEEDLLKAEKSWIRDFLGRSEIERDLGTDRLRIGFVAFSESVRIRENLTNQAGSINGAANKMQGRDLTYVDNGMRDAGRVLDGAGKHDTPDRKQIVLLLSDFQFCKRDMKANGGLDKDVTVITVGFGREYNRKNAQSMASERALALEPNDTKKIVDLYEQVLAPARQIVTGPVTVRDQLADNMRLVPDSVQPVTITITGQLLEWQVDALPATLSYEVEPRDPGFWPVSVRAEASWTDTDGLAGSAPFPEVNVEVIPFTETPTPTDTLTPTPTDTLTPTPTSTFTPTSTPTPGDKYLPILYRVWPEPTATLIPSPTPTICVPEEQTIDVAFIIDTSTSMNFPTQAGGKRKLDAAIEAAIEIVSYLKPTDQATVVGFNATGLVAAQLTADKAVLVAALRSLPNTQAPGTAIDQGIILAHQELESGRHRPNNKQSMILVTDGAQTVGDPQVVRDAATAAKADGIVIATIGLGPDIDEQLLIDVASDPELYFRAPNAEDLLALYREIARLIPCR